MSSLIWNQMSFALSLYIYEIHHEKVKEMQIKQLITILLI